MSRKCNYITGSRKLDIIIFTVLALSVLVASYWRLRVYHQVTAVKVGLIQIESDGTRRALPTPEPLKKIWTATDPCSALRIVENKTRSYIKNSNLLAHFKRETQLEWKLRYSHNSMSLDQEHIIVFEKDEFE